MPVSGYSDESKNAQKKARKNITSDAIKRDCINEIWEFLSEQSIVLPVIGEKFPLEEVKEAVIASQRPKKDGKVMLVF